MDYIIQETILYIESKNNMKTNDKNIIKPTDKPELKKFMGVSMYMATFKLPCPGNYWTEKIPLVVENFTVNRFEELRSSIHFNSAIGSATSTEESGKKVQPLIDRINARFHLLKPSP